MSLDFTYLDFDVDFIPNEFTNDISVRKDLRAIRQSVTNLLLTRPKERFFGSSKAAVGLQNLFFELKQSAFDSTVFIRETAREVINKYEPRVIFKDLLVLNDDQIADGTGIVVEVTYDVVAYGGDTDSLETSSITDGVTITIEGPANG